jgi:peptide/nickel transport system ATP-binding protein
MMTTQQPTENNVVLDVKDLRVYYETPRGDVLAVDGISFQIYERETLGLIGESGCGKSTAAFGILRLVQPPGRIVSGEVWIKGTNLATLSENELRGRRWSQISLIPQGAMNSLNPVMKVKDQISDAITAHQGKMARPAMKERILELLNTVGLPNRTYDMHPHELSGGMKQRVCIAMAIALTPTLVIADEFTSALDVVVQRVVAQTMLRVKEKLGMSMLVIGHDMGLLAQLVDRMAVMYAGHVVEVAPAQSIYTSPMHPYTQLLIDSIPSIKERKPLKITAGITHDPRNPPPGCIFHLRCPHVMERCRTQRPPMHALKPNHYVACHLHEKPKERKTDVVSAAPGNP